MTDRMGEIDFKRVLDFLDEHEGRRMYVEAGHHHPRGEGADDSPTIKVYATLGKLEMSVDKGHGGGVAWVPFKGVGRAGLQLDPERFRSGEEHELQPTGGREVRVIRLVFDGLYLAMSGPLM